MEKKRIFPKYKEDHKVGMKVSKGGSNCTKCKHLVNKNECNDEEFVQWNYGEKVIPGTPDSYCCDFWKPKASTLDKVKLK